MNINDPFGRLSARQERDYQSLCRSWRKAGLTDPTEAVAQLTRIRKRGIVGVCISIPLALMLMLALPELRILFLSLGTLLVLWIVNATRKGQLYLQRYIKEELLSPSSRNPDP